MGPSGTNTTLPAIKGSHWYKTGNGPYDAVSLFRHEPIWFHNVFVASFNHAADGSAWATQVRASLINPILFRKCQHVLSPARDTGPS